MRCSKEKPKDFRAVVDPFSPYLRKVNSIVPFLVTMALGIQVPVSPNKNPIDLDLWSLFVVYVRVDEY